MDFKLEKKGFLDFDHFIRIFEDFLIDFGHFVRDFVRDFLWILNLDFGHFQGIFVDFWPFPRIFSLISEPRIGFNYLNGGGIRAESGGHGCRALDPLGAGGHFGKPCQPTSSRSTTIYSS